jgi:hypothetical protein
LPAEFLAETLTGDWPQARGLIFQDAMADGSTLSSEEAAQAALEAPLGSGPPEFGRVAALVIIIIIAAVACLALNWPGHFSYDSVVQLAEGRTGSYGGTHPPAMSWLLGLAAAVSPGAVLFVCLDVALIWGSLLALALAAGGASWRAGLVAAVLAFTPQLLIYPAIVWKDVLFAGSICAGFSCLAWAANDWSRRARRWPWLAGALALLTLAALARQNGAVALPMAAVAVGAIAASAGAGIKRSVGYGAGFLASAAAFALAANLSLAARLDDGPPAVAGQIESLQVYDLVGALARDPKLALPLLRDRAPQLENAIRTEGVALYSPSRIDPIAPVLDIGDPDGRDGPLLSEQWRDLVLAHPWLYAQVRASDFAWVFLTPRPEKCVLVETGVEGPDEEMAQSGLAPRDTAMDDVLGAYGLAFGGTPVSSHAFYALVAAGLIAILLRRRAGADIAVAAMLASALLFAVSFAIISVSCDYRYLYAVDVATMAAAVYVASGTGRRRGTIP